MFEKDVLKRGFFKIRANCGCTGSDGQDLASFEARLDDEIITLYEEIASASYKPNPAKCTVVIKNEKERQIHLFAIRDKVVQAALAQVLDEWYIDHVPDGVYGFIKGRGVQRALKAFEALLEEYQMLCKADILNFFDNIPHGVIKSVLEQYGFDSELITLILKTLQYEYYESGLIHKKTIGIAQGSHLSPVLSNIVLLGLDQAIGEGFPYLRYVDDIIFCGTNQSDLDLTLNHLEIQLKLRGLTLNPEKTKFYLNSDTINYLGFEYISRKKSIPVKAYRFLECKIKTIENHPFMDSREKLAKIKRISDGWRQFYELPQKNQIQAKVHVNLEHYADTSSIKFHNPMRVIKHITDQFPLDTNGYKYIDLVQGQGYKCIQDISSELDENWLQKHIDGKIAILGTFLKKESSLNGVVLDIDLSKGVLMNPAYDHVKEELMLELKNAVVQMVIRLNQLEVYPTIEYSGRRGYHLWIVFEKPLPSNEVLDFCAEFVLSFKTDNIKIDILPDSTRSSYTLRMPLGRHPLTMQWSFFVNEHLEEISPENVINTFRKSKVRAFSKLGETVRYEQLDMAYISKQYGNETSLLLEKCKILRFLIEKAFETHYLDHGERLTLALNFMQLPSGSHFLHYVMKQTFNYKRGITEKMLSEIHNKPIGCLKMKERHQQANLSFDCDCHLSMTRFSYDTPLNHLPIQEKRIDPEQLKLEMDQIYQNYLNLKLEKKVLEKKLIKAENELLKKINDHSNDGSINCSTGKILRVENEGKFIFALYPY